MVRKTRVQSLVVSYQRLKKWYLTPPYDIYCDYRPPFFIFFFPSFTPPPENNILKLHLTFEQQEEHTINPGHFKNINLQVLSPKLSCKKRAALHLWDKDYFYYHYCYYYYSFFSHQLTLMVFHWSLSDSKSPQVSRTLLSILTVLNNAIVWMVSTRRPTSKSSSPFSNPLVTVPKAPITSGIIVTRMFHSFFNTLARSRYLSFFSHSFSFILWSAETAKLTISLVLFFFFFVDYYKVRSSGRD